MSMTPQENGHLSAQDVTAPPVVEVSGLSISYAAGKRLVPVARDVSFRLHRGESIGLVGESGSGKTTVATALLGTLRGGSQVVAGQVHVVGQDVLALRGEQLRTLRGATVALVSQNAGHSLTPSLRVGRQIAETLTAHGLEASEQAIATLAQRVHLDDPSLLQRYPHELSGGQQQRIAIAMAIAADPEVLVLDEPTTALDVITQRAILDLIAELRTEMGVAVVVVSHDLGVVAELADTALVMRQGQVVESGSTATVLLHPEHRYTQTLVQAAPRLHITSLTDPETERSQAETVLRCEGLDIRYRRNVPLAVHNFSAEVRQGETLAVVGQSGSGKSTVARALGGLLTAEHGTARYFPEGTTGEGQTLLKPAYQRSAETRKAIQLVFQNADLALNPRRTVGDAIARPLKYFGIADRRGEISERVEALLQEVGLDGSYARRLPAQLSGGQRQRIGIARALAAEPRLLIADEITTALDVSVQAEVLDLLSTLQERRGLSCLFISHDLAVVQRVAHRVLVMKNGVTVEQGHVETILRDPAQSYTKQLLEATVHLDSAA